MGERIINKEKFFRTYTGVAILFFGLFFSSPGQAQSAFSRLDEWMDANANAMGGRTILVVYKDGKIIYNKSVSDMNQRQKSLVKYVARKQGYEADLDLFTLDSRQMIASCSKWLSAALVMTFVDEGKLHLSDTVGLYLTVLSRNGKGNITISECLSHLTGIKAPPLKESLKEMKKIRSMDQAVEEISMLPMEGSHGKVFHYSNTGLQIAGAIIEKISGQSFGELFAERIAKPLGLKNTDFGKGPVALPAGGASSTPEDYLKFLTMILNNGKYNGVQILTEGSIREMEINRLSSDVKIAYSPAEAEGLGYGFGEWVVKNPDADISDNWVTSPGLFGSFPWVDINKHYCAFLMTFNLNFKDRHERYFEMKKILDESLLSQ
jgi:CubicO group peptidase (beta-lactamase class C family)